MTLSILIITAYLIGSIPTGLLLGKMYGVDVRRAGSGNIGATNLYRTVGRSVGVLTLIGDALKGLLPVLVIKYGAFPADYAVWVALGAFCGHVFSIFLKFKGGKGVATALGVFLALSPAAVGVAMVVFAVLVALFRYVSLASIMAAAAMPVAITAFGGGVNLKIVTMIIAVIVIVRHSENIKRLIAGTENRFKA